MLLAAANSFICSLLHGVHRSLKSKSALSGTTVEEVVLLLPFNVGSLEPPLVFLALQVEGSHSEGNSYLSLKQLNHYF